MNRKTIALSRYSRTIRRKLDRQSRRLRCLNLGTRDILTLNVKSRGFRRRCRKVPRIRGDPGSHSRGDAHELEAFRRADPGQPGGALYAFHREQEAFHAGQEAHHGEQRATHAAEMEKVRGKLESFKAASESLKELAEESIHGYPGQTPKEAPDLDPGRLTPTRMIRAVVESHGPDDRFGANGVAAEVNRRFHDRLRAPMDGRTVSVVLRRMKDERKIRLVQPGRPHFEALYSLGS